MKIIDLSKPLKALLMEHRACDPGVEWAASFDAAAAAWEACERPDWMLWALQEIGYEDQCKLRLFACWCARNTPLADGRTTWDLLTDPRSRTAVEVAERFARGEATEHELGAAFVDALAAAKAVGGVAAYDAACAAAYAAFLVATYDAACAAFLYAAKAACSAAGGACIIAGSAVAACIAISDPARSTTWYAAEDAAWDVARVAQSKALREIVGNPFSAKGT